MLKNREDSLAKVFYRLRMLSSVHQNQTIRAHTWLDVRNSDLIPWMILVRKYLHNSIINVLSTFIYFTELLSYRAYLISNVYLTKCEIHLRSNQYSIIIAIVVNYGFAILITGMFKTYTAIQKISNFIKCQKLASFIFNPLLIIFSNALKISTFLHHS